MRFHFVATLAALAIGSATAQTIVDVAVENGNFTILVELVTAAGLGGTLSGDGPFTVFAPLDSAFADVPVETVDRLKEPQYLAHLQDLLTYHVVEDEVPSSALQDGQVVPTLNTESVTVTITEGTDGGIFINDEEVALADVPASNGLIHAMNGVLLPTSATSNIVEIAQADPDNFSTLVSLLGLAELDSVLTGDTAYTVFAPTNAAFDKLDPATVAFLTNETNKAELEKVLLYHVVSGVVLSTDLTDGMMATTVEGSDITIGIEGETVTINEDSVVGPADVLANNGVIHVIDTVLTLPQDMTMPSTPVPTTAAPGPGNIVEVAVENGNFTILVELVTAAGLGPTLSGDGPFTVFAPLDSAFADVPVETVDRLKEPQYLAHLQDLLTYHVVEDEVPSSALQDGQVVETLNTESVTVTITEGTDGGIFINDEEVALADVPASNGLIHAMNGVLLPTSATSNIVEIAQADPDNFSTLVSLLGLAELDSVLAGGDYTVFAPTNAAFDKLDPATVAFLTNETNKADLEKVLLYHVVSGVVLSTDLTDGMMATTVEGSEITIGIEGETVTINEDSVVGPADVLANNGVIHVIDTVLTLPQDMNMTMTMPPTPAPTPMGTTEDTTMPPGDMTMPPTPAPTPMGTTEEEPTSTASHFVGSAFFVAILSSLAALL